MTEFFFFKPEKNNLHTWYGPKSFKHPQLRKLISFIRAFSGCDSTSGFHFQGKNKLIRNLNFLLSSQKHQQLIDDLSYFYSEDTNENKIIEVGEQVIKLLYTGRQFKYEQKLNQLRYILYRTKMRNKSFELSKLPPTESAASQHSLRAWAQVLTWKKIKVDVDKSGWEIKEDSWYPLKLGKHQKLIPEEILKDLSCKCLTDCSKKTCGCFKHGLKSSEFCLNCE